MYFAHCTFCYKFYLHHVEPQKAVRIVQMILLRNQLVPEYQRSIKVQKV